MIHYALICGKGHGFEGWFEDSDSFDKQAKRKLIACPICHSSKVEKAIMAPRLSSSTKKKGIAAPAMPAPAEAATSGVAPAQAPVAMISPLEQEFRAKLKELRNHLTKNAANVGTKFPEEARKMHYGETDQRSIYGVATADDAKALAEEGIEFQPLPVLPDEKN